MGTSIARSTANPDFYKRGEAVPGIWVNGMNVLAVREASKYAVAHCSAGKGPISLQMETYRYHGHSLSDPGTTYRTRDEIKKVRDSTDPVNNFKEMVLTLGLINEEELKQIDAQAKRNVEKATDEAKADIETRVEELTADIYASDSMYPEIRNVVVDRPLKHMRLGKANNLK